MSCMAKLKSQMLAPLTMSKAKLVVVHRASTHQLSHRRVKPALAEPVGSPSGDDPLAEQTAMGKLPGTCRYCSVTKARLTEHAKASARSRSRWRQRSVRFSILQILAGDACEMTRSIGAFTVGA